LVDFRLGVAVAGVVCVGVGFALGSDRGGTGV
jgi:hypothetical protein